MSKLHISPAPHIHQKGGFTTNVMLDVIIAMGTEVNSAITSVSTLVLFAVVPFNLLKGVIVSIATFFLYKRLEPVFFRK